MREFLKDSFKKFKKIDFGQIIITLCVIALAIWCSLNVSHIYQKFYKRETIISLQNDPPDETEFPGITICAPTIFTTDKLAELYSEFDYKMRRITKNLRPETWATQLGLNPDDNEYWQLIRERHELFQEFESRALEQHSAIDVITKLSVKLEEIIDECHFNSYNIRNYQTDVEHNKIYYDCSELKEVLESVYEGKKCFTYFSSINDPNKDSPKEHLRNEDDQDYESENNSTALNDAYDIQYDDYKIKSQKKQEIQLTKQKSFGAFCESACEMYSDYIEYFNEASRKMIFDMNPSIELRVKSLESRIWSMFTGDNSILMTVHPPNILQNRRDFLFFQISKKNNYEISFTKKTTILKEYPYRTNCAHYDQVNKQKIKGVEINTRDECISTCIKLISNQETTCIQWYSVLIRRTFRGEEHDLQSKICDHLNQNYTMFLESRKICEIQCKPECRKSIFEISGRVLTSLDDKCSSSTADYSAGGPANNYDHLPREETFVKDSSAQKNKTKYFQNDKITLKPLNETKKNPTHKAIPPGRYRNRDHKSYVDRNLDYFRTSSSHWKKKPDSKKMNYHSYMMLHHPEHPNRIRRSANYTLHYSNRLPSTCNARVSIRISPKPFTTVEHQPAVSFEGFLGTIGGHIGIWLGLSLYKIIKFLVHIIYSMIHNFFDLCR